MEIKLKDVPCEVQDKLARENEFGVRIAGVLKKISFPDRDKMIFSVHSNFGMDSQIVKMYIEVPDTRSGIPMALSHERAIKSDVTDEELAEELLIMLVQYVSHEFMERFRYDGKILCNPHDAGRNGIMFPAIEKAVRAKPAPMPEFTFHIVADHSAPQYFATFHTDKTKEKKPKKETPQPGAEPKTPLDKMRALKAKRKDAFNQFKPKDWRDKKRAA